MLRVIRGSVLVSTLAILLVLTARVSEAQTTNCAPSHPPDPCGSLPMLYSASTIHAWPQCDTLRVDIVESSMQGSCSSCPGGRCVGCILEAYRQNGFPAWNSPFHSLFNHDIFREVKGKPFDIRVRMIDKNKWQTDPFFASHRNAPATTDNTRTNVQVSGCGSMLSVGKTTTFLNGGFPWNLNSSVSGSARQVAVHELGHALALQDVFGVSIPTIMDNNILLTWTANPADGQALACLYAPIRSHLQCP